MTMKYILSTLTLCALATASCQSYDALDTPAQEVAARVKRHIFRLTPLKHGSNNQINQDASEKEDEVATVVVAGKASIFNKNNAEVAVPSANRTNDFIFVANLNESDATAMVADEDKYTTEEYNTADYLRGLNNNPATKVIPMVGRVSGVWPGEYAQSTAPGATVNDLVYPDQIVLRRLFARVEFETFPLPEGVTVTALKVVNIPGKFRLAAAIDDYDLKNAADAGNYPYLELTLNPAMDQTRRIKQTFYIPEHSVSNPVFQNADDHSMTCISMVYTQDGQTKEARLKIASTDAGKHGALREEDNGRVVRNVVYRCWIDLERVRSFGSTQYWWAN